MKECLEPAQIMNTAHFFIDWSSIYSNKTKLEYLIIPAISISVQWWELDIQPSISSFSQAFPTLRKVLVRIPEMDFLILFQGAAQVVLLQTNG